MSESWTIMRQIVVGAADLAETSETVRRTFNLSPGFPDELLEEIGLADETIPVGDQAHLEIVGPLRPDASINGWLAKVGGTAGYCLSVQVPDLEPHLAAIEKAGVRLAIQTEAYGRRIVQTHPGDMGLLVELDEIPEPGEWFWDHLEHPPSPNPYIDDVVAVDLASPDPAARAELWAAVFCTDLEERDGVPFLRLGSREVRFVKDDTPRLSAIEVHATAAGADLPEQFELGRLTFRVHQP